VDSFGINVEVIFLYGEPFIKKLKIYLFKFRVIAKITLESLYRIS
jgi:hypothetical protein